LLKLALHFDFEMHFFPFSFFLKKKTLTLLRLLEIIQLSKTISIIFANTAFLASGFGSGFKTGK
jgi:hypothetical protein